MAQADKKETASDSVRELGRDEEIDRAVESKIRQISLARHRLADLQGTLWDPAVSIIMDLLVQMEQEVRNGDWTPNL